MHKEEIECVNDHENVRVSTESDRISSLPDEIIHRILSFNDTKFAVQTSVLSSRWKLLWTTLPYLKLYSDAFRFLPNFFKFVDRVLSLRNNHTQVSTLELYSHQIEDWRILERIANYAVSRNVQKVDFVCYQNKYGADGYQLPLCFFNSQSLNHLRVKTYQPRDCIPPLPQSPWETPALTTVELHFIEFSAICLDLFSKCVNLMNLTLKYCRSREVCAVMKIQCPRLVHLSISECWISEYEILAPNLSSFSYEGFSPPLLSRGGLKSLEKVNLCVEMVDLTCSSLDNEEMQTKAHDFMNMLHDLSSARFVTLHAPVIEFLSEVLDLVEHQPSPLCNLKCLSIKGVKTERKRLKSYITNQVVNYLLNSSPTATVNMEYPEGKLHDAVGELPKEEKNSPSKQERVFTDNLGKDADGGMSCVGENVPTKSMESGKSSTSDIFAAVQADFEAKMESLKASMEVEFSRRLEAQQVEFSRRLEAQQVEFSRRLEAQQVEFSRRLESQQVEFSRHLKFST